MSTYNSNQTQNVPDALQYVPTCTTVLDLPFNLTVNKEFILGMPYQLMEDNRSTVVMLLNVQVVLEVEYLAG